MSRQVFYLKPLRDKGFSGWLFRAYPEPWQVQLPVDFRKYRLFLLSPCSFSRRQAPLQVLLQQKEDGEEGVVVAISEDRPTFNEAVAAIKRAGFERGGGGAGFVL